MSALNTESTRVLITHRALFSIGGSELTVYEIARHYREAGAEVLLFSHGVGDVWRTRFEELGTRILTSGDDQVDRILDEYNPQIVWCCHSLAPIALVVAAAGRRFIFLHLSSFEPLEFVRYPRLEGMIAGRVLFVAEEALERQRATGLMRNISESLIGIWGNPVADPFFRVRALDTRELRRLLIVSNHLSDELIRIIPRLEERCEVRILGVESQHGAVSRLIDSSDLEWSDAVISIGKTVQMGIAAGRPVFCFDVHGGPGWLAEENIRRAAAFNFSGRGFAPYRVEDLEDDLFAGFPKAAESAERFRREYGENYRLSRRIEKITSETTPVSPNVSVDEVDIATYRVAQDLERGYIHAIEARTRTVEYLEVKNDLAEARIRDLEISLSKAHLDSAHGHSSLFQRWWSRARNTR